MRLQSVHIHGSHVEAEGRFTYIPQGEKRYQTLTAALSRPKTSAKPKAGPAASPQVKTTGNKETGKAKWWESEPKDVKPGDIFKKDPVKKKKEPVSLKKNWWET